MTGSRIILPIGLLLVTAFTARAQVSALYTFAQAAGTYTPITGGSLLAQTTFDDNVFQVDVPTFFFNGSYYNALQVSANGYITVGAPAAVNNYLPISSTATYTGSISPFGTNLIQATTGSPEIRYEQVGNELVVQWQDVKRATAGTERFSFQSRINIVTGVVRFMYSAVANLNSVTVNQPQTGLRGTTNAEYKNRKLLSGGGTWLNSTGGTAANHTMRFTSTAPAQSPTGGETFTFTPACLSPVATTSVTTSCLTNSFTVAVSISSLGSAPSANIVASTSGTPLFSGVPAGNYSCGPFTLGSAVTITVVNSSNAACTNNLGAFNPATICATIANGVCLDAPFLAIPDDGCGSGTDLQAIIPISGMNTTLGSGAGQTKIISIEMIIAHTYRGDLQVRLSSPSGQTRNLLIQEPSPLASGSNIGNPGGCPGLVVQVRDDASQPLSAMDPDLNNITGVFLPEQPLSGFTGNANGNWILRVCDNSLEDAGTLNFIRIRLGNVDCASVVNGTALPGTACDDGIPNTSGDTWQANCACVGQATAVVIAPRVFLEGPLDVNTLLMHDSLRTKNLIPLTEPYTALGFTLVGGGAETTTAPVLATSGQNAIVDWVLVELRDATTNTTVTRSQCALVQRDGDVVSIDGTSPLSFTVPAGSYFIAVRHRNHLGAMTSTALPLSSTITSIDLTSLATATFGTSAQNTIGTVRALWAGNVIIDNAIRYTGGSNDRDPILVRIGGTIPTNTTTGYFAEDVDMDGKVKYTGNGNDRDPILVNIGGTVPTNSRLEQLP